MGKPFDVTKLHVWGCDAYVHVDKGDRTRLEPRARKGVYVGFDMSSNCDLVYFLDTKRLVSSFHTKFDETYRPAVPVKNTDPFNDEGAQPAASQLAQAAGSGPVPRASAPGAQSATTSLGTPAGYSLSTTTGSVQDQAGGASPAATANGSSMPDLPPWPVPLEQPVGSGATTINASRAQVEGEVTTKTTQTHATTQKKDPDTLREALESDEGHLWEDAYLTELQNLLGFGTFTLVKRSTIPTNTRVLGHKVVCKRKLDENGHETKKKCRIVAQGFMENTDGQLTFAPVSTYSSIRLVLSIAAALDLELHQADIKSAYLLSYLPEDRHTYMSVPEGLPKTDELGNELVCKLVRGIYGLSSSGRLWSDELCAFMTKQGFKRAHGDPALYYKGSGRDIFLVSSHVDDLLMAASKEKIDEFLAALKTEGIEVSAQGELTYLLNMQVERDRANKTVTLHQSSYVRTLLENFHMDKATPLSTPMTPNVHLSKSDPDKTTGTRNAKTERYSELIGSLLYLSNTVRPDISAHVGQLSRFLSCPKEHHWNEAVHILRYLKGQPNLGITFDGKVSRANQVHGFADSDLSGCNDTGRSTGGYVFLMNGAAISWSSKRQPVVAQSTAEAELIAVSAAAQEAAHLKFLLEELGFPQQPIVIYEDNQPCIKIAENPITSSKTKHIARRYFYVREAIAQKIVELKGIDTGNMVADCLTKSLNRQGVEKHRAIMLGTHNRKGGTTKVSTM